jgi:hypothetical protein
MANIPNNNSLNGKRFRFGEAPEQASSEADYNHGGTLVCTPGDEGTITQGFDDWNGVEGLTIFYVRFDRGTVTHLAAKDFTLID